MASVSNDPGGTRRVLFGDGKRKTIRLGKVDRRTADAVARHVEALLAARVSGQPVPRETAAWVAGIGATLRDRLAAVGLVEARTSRALGDFMNVYLDQRRADSKPATAVTIRTVVNDLTGFFGPAADLRTVTAEKAYAFKRHYQERELAPATAYRRLKMAKMLFGHAAKLKLIDANPFLDVKSKNHNPPERRR